MDAICDEYSDSGIEEALARVPENMDATYERILDTINKKPRVRHELARKVLIWTAYARSPLLINDLASAVSVKKDTKSLEDMRFSIPTEMDILNACANLVLVDQNDLYTFRYKNFS